jgi:hypothetical protein
MDNNTSANNSNRSDLLMRIVLLLDRIVPTRRERLELRPAKV